MITTTSLKHSSIQTKIKSVRVQAEHLGLIGKVYNSKGVIILVAVKYSCDDHARFYLVDKDGIVGKDVTDMVLKACPYDVYIKPKSFFEKVVTSVKNAVTGVQAKAAVSVSPMFVYF